MAADDWGGVVVSVYPAHHLGISGQDKAVLHARYRFTDGTNFQCERTSPEFGISRTLFFCPMDYPSMGHATAGDAMGRAMEIGFIGNGPVGNDNGLVEWIAAADSEIKSTDENAL